MISYSAHFHSTHLSFTFTFYISNQKYSPIYPSDLFILIGFDQALSYCGSNYCFFVIPYIFLEKFCPH